MDGTDEHECDNTHEGSSNAIFSDFFPTRVERNIPVGTQIS